MAYADTAKGAFRENAKAAAAVANLTATVGTADGTIADVGAAFNQGTLNDNFRDIADKINALLAAMRTAGLLSS